MNPCPPHHWVVEPVPSDDLRNQIERWSCKKCLEAVERPVWRADRGWGPIERKVMKGDDE